MTNRIHKEQVGKDLWNLFTEDFSEFIHEEHEDYHTNVTVLYVIDDTVTDDSDYWGEWFGYGTYNRDWGLTLYIDYLDRVELKEIVKKEYVLVK